MILLVLAIGALIIFVAGLCCGLLLTDDHRYPDWFDEDRMKR